MQIRDPGWKNSYPGSGMEKSRIRDPGWKKVGSMIRDKHRGSATQIIVKLINGTLSRDFLLQITGIRVVEKKFLKSSHEKFRLHLQKRHGSTMKKMLDSDPY
jgi:hypothetical protein